MVTETEESAVPWLPKAHIGKATRLGATRTSRLGTPPGSTMSYANVNAYVAPWNRLWPKATSTAENSLELETTRAASVLLAEEAVRFRMAAWTENRAAV